MEKVVQQFQEQGASGLQETALLGRNDGDMEKTLRQYLTTKDQTGLQSKEMGMMETAIRWTIETKRKEKVIEGKNRSERPETIAANHIKWQSVMRKWQVTQ